MRMVAAALVGLAAGQPAMAQMYIQQGYGQAYAPAYAPAQTVYAAPGYGQVHYAPADQVAPQVIYVQPQVAPQVVYVQPQVAPQVVYVSPMAGSKRTVHGNYAHGGVAFQPGHGQEGDQHTYRWVSVLGHQATPNVGQGSNPSQAAGVTRGFQNGFGHIYGTEVERVIAGTIQPAPLPVEGRTEGYFLPFPKYVNWRNNPDGLYDWER